MTVHANDIIWTIREALKSDTHSAQAPSQSGILVEPNPDQQFENRDGRLMFECIGRDWIRAFRITVEAISIEDAPEAAAGYDDQPPQP